MNFKKTALKVSFISLLTLLVSENAYASRSSVSIMTPRNTVKISKDYTYGYSYLPGNALDVYETPNRKIGWIINYDLLDKNLLRPVSVAYVTYIPQGVRDCIYNFNQNLREVNNTVNNILVARPVDSSISVGRFLINSTIGIAGCFDVATHMGYIPENPLDENFNTFCIAVRTVAQHLKKNNQYLLFETGQETPVTMMRCFEKVGTDNLGVNLDTANLILYGKANPVDALDVFGKYVRNLHAKDGKYPTNGKDLGAETKIGEGKVDFYGVIKGLRDVGYGGYITIEREIEGDQQIKDIMESKEYLQNIIDEVYGG